MVTMRKTMASVRIRIPLQDIRRFCRRWKVSELALFGSVLRDDFQPDSDVDVLMSLEPDARVGLFDLVTMQRELASIFGREVDLVDRAAIEKSQNYIRRKAILGNFEVIYAARRRIPA
jgi:uncharacterized protein